MDNKIATERQLLGHFRTVAKSYAQLFRAQKDHVHHLLAGAHNYSSGVFREGLIRSFLKAILPKAVSVDSGFVYGFEQVPTSRQIDILVWDSARHAAVYQTHEFVIIPPESVIAAISVKTTLDRADIHEALENLLSLEPIEYAYRSEEASQIEEPFVRPILKLVVGYEGPATTTRALEATKEFFEGRFAASSHLARRMIAVLGNFDPVNPCRQHVDAVESMLPKLIASIETNPFSLVQGWGPPEDQAGRSSYGPGLRRLPYMYAQDSQLTTPLEKVVYHVLRSTYATLGTAGWSLVSAWGEFNPITGTRVGDAEEILESQNARLLDPQRLAGT
jgi:hypothetical protein